MALDTGNYISDLSRLNPTATDPVSEGDDVLRFIKKSSCAVEFSIKVCTQNFISCPPMFFLNIHM